MKSKSMDIEQNKDKTYTVTIQAVTENAEGNEALGQKVGMILSRIELNPEDILIIQKFMNVHIF